MENISITRKIKYLQSRLNDLSTVMISRMVHQLSEYLNKTDLDSFFIPLVLWK